MLLHNQRPLRTTIMASTASTSTGTSAAAGSGDVSNDVVHGHCYCGAVEVTIKRDAKSGFAAFCHCDSCCRAHGAPMMQVVWTDDKNITIKGDALKKFTKKAGIITRAFCGTCGSRIYNAYASKPGFMGIFPPIFDEDVLVATRKGWEAAGDAGDAGDDAAKEEGTTAKAMPASWAPQLHNCHTEAHFNLGKLDDGIMRR